MELATCGTDALGELGLDVHVDVFELDGEVEVARIDVFFDLAEASFDLVEFVLGEDASFHLRTCMGDGACDVVFIEAPVIGDGFSVLLYEVCCCF